MVRNHPCELNIFVLQLQLNLGRRFGTSKMQLSPLVVLVAVRSKAVVLLLLIRCLFCFAALRPKSTAMANQYFLNKLSHVSDNSPS